MAERETGSELRWLRVRPWMVRKDIPAAWTVRTKSRVRLEAVCQKPIVKFNVSLDNYSSQGELC